MIYYLIFCLTTVIITIWRCQYPVVKEIRSDLLSMKNLTYSIVFWSTLITIDFIFAPLLFLATIIVPEKYMMNMAAMLYEGKNKS